VQAAKVEPRQPDLSDAGARDEHLREVQLRVLVAKDGTVKSVTLISGDPLLAQSAIEAVKQCGISRRWSMANRWKWKRLCR
jgi:hypothetical protein